MKSLNYLMDHIMHQKKENRITFKIKTGYYLELLTPETIN